MPFKIVKKNNQFRIKNMETGKMSSNKFKLRKNAQIQLNNRIRYEKRFVKRKPT